MDRHPDHRPARMWDSGGMCDSGSPLDSADWVSTVRFVCDPMLDADC